MRVTNMGTSIVLRDKDNEGIFGKEYRWGSRGIYLQSPKFRGWRKAHRRHARSRGMEVQALDPFIARSIGYPGKTVTTYWEA